MADEINIQAKRGTVETVRLDGQRLKYGSLARFIQKLNHEYRTPKGI